jgi:CubicO group peptidase (beta-lactamase class C family)
MSVAGFDEARLGRIDRHFGRYVEDGRLPGWLLLISRGGKVVYLSTRGHRDVAAGLAVEADTLFRIYSMTKPITAVAAMMLYEEGAFDLRDPVSRFIPAFDGVRVFREGTAVRPVTVPATEPIRIWHLLTHTAGLTYGFLHRHVVDEMYRAAGFDLGSRREWTWRPAASAGRRCRSSSNPAASGTTPWPATSWGTSWRLRQGGRWMPSSPSASSVRSG